MESSLCGDRLQRENQEPISLASPKCEKAEYSEGIKRYFLVNFERATMRREEHSLYLNGTEGEIAEYLKDILPEYRDLDVEAILLQQESALLYFQSNRQQNVTSDYGQHSNSSNLFFPTDQSESSLMVIYEALARALDLDDDFRRLCISEPPRPALENTRSTPRETPVLAAAETTRQDDIDPNRMTYESELDQLASRIRELQSLGESVGSESRGLPVDLISRLPTFKYKAEMFSEKKKEEKEECVICCAEYETGVKLTSLPCAHHYHTDCITQWLQLKKLCPVCQEEVHDQ